MQLDFSGSNLTPSKMFQHYDVLVGISQQQCLLPEAASFQISSG